MKWTTGLAGLLIAALMTIAPLAQARSSYHSTSYRPHTGATHVSSPHHSGSHKAVGIARDANGKIKRSQTAKNDFKQSHPCPATGRSSGACPGYVIDHVKALKRGGADAPSNMQWQTKEAAKQKDKTE
jgi:hypothetical protein